MATNMFIKFEDPAIDGGSTAQGHAKEIEVLSWNHGFVQPGSPTRGTVEQANHAHLTFTKYLDAATNDLLKMCWSGKQIGKATLRCYRSDGAHDSNPVEYLQVILQHVIIANFSVSGGPGDVPVENVSLEYGVVQYIYKQLRQQDESAMHDLRSRAIQ